LRPDLTVTRAIRLLARWWWVATICVVLVVVAWSTLPALQLSPPTARARVHLQDTTISYSYSGVPQAFTPQRSVNDLNRGDFIDPNAAASAAPGIGHGVGSGSLTSALGFTALTGTDAQLSYTGGGSETEAARRLSAYVQAFVRQRRQSQSAALLAAAHKVTQYGGSSDTAKALEIAAKSLDQQIYQVGPTTSSSARRVPRSLSLVGALLAGLVLALLVVLAVDRFDPRIRSIRDLRLAGVDPIGVDAARGGAPVEALRALAEASGVDMAGQAVAIVTPRSGDDVTGLARALADAFVGAGRPATLLSDGRVLHTAGGSWSPVKGSGALTSLPRLREALAADAEDVIVIGAPGLLDSGEPVVAATAARFTVVAVRRGKTTWTELERCLALLGRLRPDVQPCVVINRSARTGRLAAPRAVLPAPVRAPASAGPAADESPAG
jgi:hypothetical protein